MGGGRGEGAEEIENDGIYGTTEVAVTIWLNCSIFTAISRISPLSDANAKPTLSI